MRVALVYPTTGTVFEHPPLGLMYIASSLQKTKHEVKIFECSKRYLPFDMLAVRDFCPHVIGVTCMTPMFHEVLELAKFAKHQFKLEPKIVVGGPHATVMPETLLEYDTIDACVLGEGELTFKKLLDGEENISGIAVKTDGKIISTPAEPIADLDALPFPARHLVDAHYFERRRTPIMSARGCPFNCSFCQPTLRKMFGSKVRRRSVYNVVEEMDECYRTLGTRHFEFLDDTFTADRVWSASLAKYLVNDRLGPKLTFDILTRVDMVDYQLLRNLHMAGLTRATFGVESGDQEILDSYCKGTTIEQVKAAFSACKQANVKTHALFMLGAPDETTKTIAATEKLIEELKPDSIYISITTPIPHTKLWDDCKAADTLACDWSEIDYYRTPSMKLNYMTSNEVVNARKRILRRFYLKKLRSPAFLINALTAHPLSYTVRAAKHIMREH